MHHLISSAPGSSEVDTIVIPILLMRKIRLGKVKGHVHIYTISKAQSWDSANCTGLLWLHPDPALQGMDPASSTFIPCHSHRSSCVWTTLGEQCHVSGTRGHSKEKQTSSWALGPQVIL